MRRRLPHLSLRRCPPAVTAFLLVALFAVETPSFAGEAPERGYADLAGPSGIIVLSGTWLMKDYTRGIGTAKQVMLPANQPRDVLPITVPGTVRTALLDAGEIPDPYFGYDNEKSLWVEDKEWWFFRSFTISGDLRGRFIDLTVDGASFQGEVYVNGTPVGELKGMLNPRAFPVSSVLKYGGENTIAVRLEATGDARNSIVTQGLTWDSPRDQLYSIAQCMYGWDWGPHGVPIGLWKPVWLRVTGPLRIDHPQVRTQLHGRTEAMCSIAVDVRNLSDVSVSGIVSGVIEEEASGGVAEHLRQEVTLEPHEFRTVRFEARIRAPKLWWPNGMGAQDLYRLAVSVSTNGEVSETSHATFGIRELKLVQNENIDVFLKQMKDAVGSQYELGKVVGSYPWTFQVNGRKMFAKGGNWIPADQLLRLGRDRYDRLLSLARDAHFNLFRVWGGGLYENDEFYELCDRYGLLTWQEFLSNRSFSKIDRDNFLEGAAAAIVRLRNHPSLSFWCGGNEFDPDDVGSKAVIDSLSLLLERLDPDREFHRASPYKGDDHYWGVWHGQEPYTKYRVVRPFRSEAGVNTFPVQENFRKFTPASMLWPLDTTFVEYHGEYNTRFQHLAKLMHYAGEFGPPSGLDDAIRKSQLYQALANAFNMEFCRSHKFQNSGLLTWQYNDIWPCISWSIVDWYGTPKPSYFYQKRASRPLHIAVDFEKYTWTTAEEFRAEVSLLNDTDVPVRNATFVVKIIDDSGKVLVSKNGRADTEANSSRKVGQVSYRLSRKLAGRTIFLSGELLENGSKISDVLYPIAVVANSAPGQSAPLFAAMNRMRPADLHVTAGDLVTREGNLLTCTLSISNPSGALAFFVRARLLEESEAVRSWYSDNWISLLPGEIKTIQMTVERRSPAPDHGPLRCEISGWNSPSQTVTLKE